MTTKPPLPTEVVRVELKYLRKPDGQPCWSVMVERPGPAGGKPIREELIVHAVMFQAPAWTLDQGVAGARRGSVVALGRLAWSDTAPPGDLALVVLP